MKSARSVIGEVDVVLLLLEACHLPGKGDEFIVKLLQQQKQSVLVVLNYHPIRTCSKFLVLNLAWTVMSFSLLSEWDHYVCHLQYSCCYKAMKAIRLLA